MRSMVNPIWNDVILLILLELVVVPYSTFVCRISTLSAMVFAALMAVSILE